MPTPSVLGRALASTLTKQIKLLRLTSPRSVNFGTILPWSLFAQALTQSGLSTVTEGPLLKKIYFPRLLAPIARTGVELVPAQPESAVVFPVAECLRHSG